MPLMPRASSARAARPLCYAAVKTTTTTTTTTTTCASRAHFHNKKPQLASAEAAPAAKPARHETGSGMRAIDGIAARRAKAGKLVAGIAAASDSDMFKGSVCQN